MIIQMTMIEGFKFKIDLKWIALIAIQFIFVTLNV